MASRPRRKEATTVPPGGLVEIRRGGDGSRNPENTGRVSVPGCAWPQIPRKNFPGDWRGL
ncbi:MAG: hypothetical protein ACK56I_31100 [bacterium]